MHSNFLHGAVLWFLVLFKKRRFVSIEADRKVRLEELRLTDICFSRWGENIGKVFERKGGRRSSRVVKGASLVSENKRKPTDPRFAPPPQPGQSLKEVKT